MSSEHAVGAIY